MAVGGDAQLAAQFAAGDPDAVRAVYQTYGRLVYSVAFKVLGDVGLAEDATQQTFVQAWRAAASYDPTRALGPWLASIARRAAIDVYRRTRRHQTHYGLDFRRRFAGQPTTFRRADLRGVGSPARDRRFAAR
jgi:RNA polymerase sigma-70 factor (ECF subfamily)